MLKKLLCFSAFMFLFVLLGLTVSATTSYAATYYVSTTGSDSNNGTSTSTPWQTLAKVTGITFNAGDQILLKSGDTWTGQTLTLKGNGTSANPIQLSAYGAGNKPIIAPGTTDSVAIRIFNYAGWKITNLELQNAFEGIRIEYTNSYNNDYIWIENLVIRHMNSSYNSDSTSYNHTSSGISVKAQKNTTGTPDIALTHLTVKNVNFYDCDTGTWFGKVGSGFVPEYSNMWTTDVVMSNLMIDGGGMWGFNALFVDRGIFTSMVAKNIGAVSNQFGAGAIIVAYSQNIEFIGGEISNVLRNPAQNYDGVGFDFEGGVGANISLHGMNIHDTAGAGIFVFNNNGHPFDDINIDNNVISHFGKNPGNSSAGIFFAGGNGIVTNNVFNNSQGRSQYEGTASGFTFTNNQINTVSGAFVPTAPTTIADPTGTSMVTAHTLGTLRNNFAGAVGYKFTTGSSPITISGLGRKAVAGNAGPHFVSLYQSSDNARIAICSVSVYSATADGLGYKYCKLASPVTLAASTAYYMLSTEYNGGDQSYDDNTTLTVGTGTINSSGYASGGAFTASVSGNHAYGPLNLLYSVSSSSNLALGGSTSASSTDTGNGYSTTKVNDGDTSNGGIGWASANPTMPQWVQIDFGTNKTFNRVELYTTGSYELRGYQIQYWNGSAWVDCFTAVTGNTQAHRTHTFTAVTGSKIRVYANQGDALSSYARVNELEVYNDSGADTTAPTAPTSLASPSKTSTTVDLTWTASTDNVGVTGYDVYNGSTKVNSSDITSTSYTVTGLTANTAYTFTVKAKDAAANVSAASSGLAVTTNAASTNLAIGGTASASSTDTANGYAASKIIDGTAGTGFTGWASATPTVPQWVQVDFGTNKIFNRVELYTTAGYEIRGYQIQYWNGSAWVDCFTAIIGNTQGHRTHTFTAVTGSKIRVYVNQGDAASSYSRVNELEVYNDVTAPTLSNAGFETPSTGTYTYGPMTNGWTFDSNTGVQHNGSEFSAATAPEGAQTAFIQNSGQFSQSVTFTAGSYTVSFQAAKRTSFGGTQSFNVYYDTTVIGTYTPSLGSFTSFTTSSFTATAGSHTIKFVGTTSGDNTDFIDVVTIN